MDQIKIGAFIAERRKAKGLTQMQLAERLGITDRAVSKWENGRSLPDSGIMLELCEILEISVNELLCGEVIIMEKYDENIEKTMLELVKQKEEADKRMLKLEIVICVISGLFLTAMIVLASTLQMQDWLRIVLIYAGMLQFIIAVAFALKIEQTAGYYECAKCRHKYVPSYRSVLFAMHVNRTRYMKCPECGKRSWQKKVINKD